jgi:pimeloyl-ACP methyl ester carboxylesterase
LIQKERVLNIVTSSDDTTSGCTVDIRHHVIELPNIKMHVAVAGTGTPLILLHGWPEFWAIWEPVMALLADRFTLFAPDLRGFGETGRDPKAPPDAKIDAGAHATDLLALMDALALPRVGLVGHDIGAYVIQALARRCPERLSGLFFFDCPTPGIGARWAEAEHLKETWYQYFHQLPWAAEMIGSSRENCRLYLGHFLRHWSANATLFEPVLERWVDNFMRPGNLQGGFDWYLSSAANRRQIIDGTATRLPIIDVPTCVLWGAEDPIIKAGWMDRLDETFSDLDARRTAGVGHFVHFEAPRAAADEIARFFAAKGV